MPKTSDLHSFEAALQALLEPVSAYARAKGIGPQRLAAMLAAAAKGRAAAAPPALPFEVGLRLVGRWASDPLYSSRGKPRPLPMRGPRSFAGLVRSARAGSAEKARAALIDQGLVRERRDGSLVLLRTSYVPQKSPAAKMHVVGRAAAEFLRVVLHNADAPAERAFLQRVASYDNIGSSSLMTLRTALRREGVRALERANALLAARDRDRRPSSSSGKRTRVSFGVYLLDEPFGAPSRRKK